jgi:hypothetical protein
MDMLWQCPLCKAKNAVGSKRCALCRNPYTGREVTAPRIREAPLEEWEEDSKVFADLDRRMREATETMGKESLPPRAAIRLVIPNNPLGWLQVAIVILALAMTLALLKTIL